MKIAAIISEYNPIHNGHVHHIKLTKELANSDAIVCIMSGNYVQRGMPAIIDKWNRTKAALECGADLILELPVVYSLSSAEFFAYGAVSLLNSLGVIDSISFGSEIGEIDFIMNIASVLIKEPGEFKVKLKLNLDKGYTYPKARSLALIDYFNEFEGIANKNLSDNLNSSNNILGIEYCKSLLRLNSSIKPYTIKRKGSAYNDMALNSIFSSATSIRKYVKDNESIDELRKHMPDKSYKLLNSLKNADYPFVFEDLMLPFIKYKYFNHKKSLINIPDVSEGLHNRIYEGLLKEDTYGGILERIKSKRYTYTRISRILCQYFVGFDNYPTNELRNQPSPYCRILGFNKAGMKALKHIKKNSSIPVYTKLPKVINTTMELDIMATQTYSLLNGFVSPMDDYLISPIIID
jgi:predicted nucleotidyltransferase